MPPEQVLTALRLANTARDVRVRVKREVAAGWATVADLVAEPDDFPPQMNRVAFFDVLQWQAHWGRARALGTLAALEKLGVVLTEMTTLGALTFRQRCVIVAYLEPVE